MGGGLFYSNPIRGIAIKYIPLRCGYLFDVVCAVGEIVLTPHTVYGRKCLYHQLIASIACFLFPKLELPSIQRLIPFAELFEADRAQPRIRRVCYGYLRFAGVIIIPVNGIYSNSIIRLGYYHVFVLDGAVLAFFIHGLFQNIRIPPRFEIVSTYIERNQTVSIALRAGYDLFPIQQ